MPEVHLPQLEDHDEHAPPAPVAPAAAGHGRRKTIVRFALEVVLISAGVFLGLMGEQWREQAHHRELADASLRRFRTEIAANRKALAAVAGYHATLKKNLAAYLASDVPKTPATLDRSAVRLSNGVGPVWFEHTAWDLALATQSLAYIDQAPGFSISRAYTVQQDYADLQRAILQTIYTRSPSQDFEGYWRSLLAFLGDTSIFDPTLLRAYDEAIAQIDRTLGTSQATTSR